MNAERAPQLKRNVGLLETLVIMEPKKYDPVAVNPQPCSAEEAEKHLRGFAESFIDKHHSERWIHLLIEKPEKADKALHKFEHQLNEICCKAIGRGSDTFPSALAEVYGSRSGVYFDGSESAYKVSVAEAATLAAERFADAIFSVEAGKLAFFFHHDSGTWVCERSL